MVDVIYFIFQLIEETPFFLLKINGVRLYSHVACYARRCVVLYVIALLILYLIDQEPFRIIRKDCLSSVLLQSKVELGVHLIPSHVIVPIQRTIIHVHCLFKIQTAGHSDFHGLLVTHHTIDGVGLLAVVAADAHAIFLKYTNRMLAVSYVPILSQDLVTLADLHRDV